LEAEACSVIVVVVVVVWGDVEIHATATRRRYGGCRGGIREEEEEEVGAKS
jgi:hypothetical protein